LTSFHGIFSGTPQYTGDDLRLLLNNPDAST